MYGIVELLENTVDLEVDGGMLFRELFSVLP